MIASILLADPCACYAEGKWRLTDLVLKNLKGEARCYPFQVFLCRGGFDLGETEGVFDVDLDAFE